MKIFKKGFRVKKRKLIFIPLAFLLIIGISLFIYIKFAYAVTRTWDGGGGADTNWSTAANWSGDTVPGASDIAAFDATSTNNSTIDAAFVGSVAGVDINTGYTGTITQSRSLAIGTSSYIQAGGNWNAGSQTLSTTKDFTISGGTFDSAGTITFNTTSTAVTQTLTCSGNLTSSGGVVNINQTGTSGGDVFTLSSGCSINLASTITLTKTATVNFNGTILSAGTITFNTATTAVTQTLNCSQTLPGTVDINQTGTSGGDVFTLSSGCSITLASAINNTKGSITNNGTMTGTNISVSENFTLGSSGVLNLSGSLTFNTSTASTLTCTNTNLNVAVVVNKTSSGNTFTMGSDCTVTNFTLTQGTVSNPAAARVLSVTGDFAQNANTTFGGANLTLQFNGTGTQSISKTAGALSTPININKSAGIAQLAANFSTSAAATVSAGTINLAGKNFTSAQSVTVQDGGIYQLYGGETITSPTLNSGSTVKYTGNGDSLATAYTIKDLNYYHLTIASTDSGDTFATPNTTEDVLGSFTLSGGIFTAPSGNFTIGGNFTYSGGTFTHNSGAVVLNDATQTAAISGSTTFNNLTSVTAGKKITVANGTTQTVSIFTLTGSAGNRISLKGVSGGSQWNLTATTPSVSYVEARDSNACGGTTVTATNSVNLGNNSCWNFFSGSSSPNEVKIQRGVNIRRGTTIQRN